MLHLEEEQEAQQKEQFSTSDDLREIDRKYGVRLDTLAGKLQT